MNQVLAYLPDPFHDKNGFPVVLLHARKVARARGGDIVPDADPPTFDRLQESWRAAPPSPDIPDFMISFYKDGVGGVYFEEHSGIDNGPDMTYKRDEKTGLTHIERLVIAVINGGYHETSYYDEDGREIGSDASINSGDVTDIGGRSCRVKPVRKVEYRYPAWPMPVVKGMRRLLQLIAGRSHGTGH